MSAVEHPRSKPRALVADPIDVKIPGGLRTVSRRPGIPDLHQIWRPCSRKHREYVLAGLLPISCSRCTHTQEDR